MPRRNLETLPKELQLLICKHLINTVDTPVDFQPDLRKPDIFFPIFRPGTTETSNTERTYSSIYKDLRSLALVSRHFRDVAQPLLFRIVVVGGPRCPQRLLKSLLLYPHNRPYIRSLFVTRKTAVDPLRLDMDTVLQFCWTLRPLVATGTMNQLYNKDAFRALDLFLPIFPVTTRSDDRLLMQTADWQSIFPGIADHVLRAIVQLSPKLIGLHLSHGRIWDASLLGAVPGNLDYVPSMAFPRVRSLTVDYGAIRSQMDGVALQPSFTGGCPSTIERLTLMGDTYMRGGLRQQAIKLLYSWLRSNTALKELRLVNGFHECLDTRSRTSSGNTSPPTITWNTILGLYASTLEVLVFEGCSKVPDRNINLNRFGPTRCLSCLGDFKRLAYLKVPLHMLRQDFPGVYIPAQEQILRHDIPHKFPTLPIKEVYTLLKAPLPGRTLKKLDLVLVTEMQAAYYDPSRRSIVKYGVLQVRGSPGSSLVLFL